MGWELKGPRATLTPAGSHLALSHEVSVSLVTCICFCSEVTPIGGCAPGPGWAVEWHRKGHRGGNLTAVGQFT